ncbi:hypothetical protein Q8A73_015632 [Channa argus]|nr:hypothetical protein Q8A73_015632 [Channa argus]
MDRDMLLHCTIFPKQVHLAKEPLPKVQSLPSAPVEHGHENMYCEFLLLGGTAPQTGQWRLTSLYGHGPDHHMDLTYLPHPLRVLRLHLIYGLQTAHHPPSQCLMIISHLLSSNHLLSSSHLLTSHRKFAPLLSQGSVH